MNNPLKLNLQQRDFLMRAYLDLDPQALTQKGDYERFRYVCLDGDRLDAEEIPSKRTFQRWLVDRREVLKGNQTRISLRNLHSQMLSVTVEEIQDQLMRGALHFDELVFWLEQHNLDKLRIEGRELQYIHEKCWPPKDTTAATRDIKSFIAGYLFARRKTL